MGKASIEKPWMKYYQEFDGDLSTTKQSLYRYLRMTSKGYENYTAINYFGKKYSYYSMIGRIDHLADCFTDLGVKKGDKIIFLTATLPETICSVYALNKIGAVPVFVEPRMSKDRIDYFIGMVKAKYVVMIDLVYPKVYDILEKYNLEHVLVQTASYSLHRFQRFFINLFSKKTKIKYSNVVQKFRDFERKQVPQIAVEPPFEEMTTAVVTQTGGTTGNPKGVELTNEGFNTVALSFNYTHNDCVPGDIFLNIMPIFASYGIVCGMHMALTQRTINVLIPNFKPKKFPGLIAKYKPAAVIGVPVFYEMLIKDPRLKNVDLSGLKFAVSGGDILNPTLEEHINKFFKEHGCKYNICQGYGMSETTAVTAFNCVYRKNSLGLPLCTSIMAAFDENTGEELDYNQTGEICITGPSVMKQYFDNPEETKNVMKLHKDGKVWMHSGDRGYIDKDGFIFFEGRFKYVIPRFDGHKTFPIQLERVVSKFKGVVNCAVVPCNDRDHMQGQYPLVVVELDNKEADLKKMRSAILKHCKKNIGGREQPCDIVFEDKIPLTLIGKNDVTSLKDKYINYNYKKHCFDEVKR